MRDFFTEQFIAKLQHEKKVKRRKKRLIYIGILAIILSAIVACLYIFDVFADNKVDKLSDGNGEYLYFEIDHNVTTAKYKYYGYGYTVALFDNATNQFIDLNNGTESGKQVFMPNKMFKSYFEYIEF